MHDSYESNTHICMSMGTVCYGLKYESWTIPDVTKYKFKTIMESFHSLYTFRNRKKVSSIDKKTNILFVSFILLVNVFILNIINYITLFYF